MNNVPTPKAGRSSVPFTARELAIASLFGAGALALPVIFHAFHLGQFFMPMYIPLVMLPFFVSPRIAAITALLVPLLSSLVSGMPPLFPPIGPVMSIELGCMAWALAYARRVWSATNIFFLLIPVLLVGRAINVLLLFVASRALGLPAEFIAGISFLSGWPGLVLILAVVPAVVRATKQSPASQ